MVSADWSKFQRSFVQPNFTQWQVGRAPTYPTQAEVQEDENIENKCTDGFAQIPITCFPLTTHEWAGKWF